LIPGLLPAALVSFIAMAVTAAVAVGDCAQFGAVVEAVLIDPPTPSPPGKSLGDSQGVAPTKPAEALVEHVSPHPIAWMITSFVPVRLIAAPAMVVPVARDAGVPQASKTAGPFVNEYSPTSHTPFWDTKLFVLVTVIVVVPLVLLSTYATSTLPPFVSEAEQLAGWTQVPPPDTEEIAAAVTLCMSTPIRTCPVPVEVTVKLHVVPAVHSVVLGCWTSAQVAQEGHGASRSRKMNLIIQWSQSSDIRRCTSRP
jgi:hypothetical protein